MQQKFPFLSVHPSIFLQKSRVKDEFSLQRSSISDEILKVNILAFVQQNCECCEMQCIGILSLYRRTHVKRVLLIFSFH